MPAVIKRTFGSITLPPMSGHRKPTLVVGQDTRPQALVSAAKVISVPDSTEAPATIKKIFGSMTLPAMPGRRKQTLPVRQEDGLWASALAAKATSERDMTAALEKTFGSMT